jgi:hypothetical protein
MQTPEERARLFNLGNQDGSMFCLDLSHADGQQAAEGLGHLLPDVAAALRTRSNNLQYLLVLIPTTSEKDIGVMLTDHTGLPEAVTAMHQRSKKFGQAFAVVIAPKSPRIAELFAPFTAASAGTA